MIDPTLIDQVAGYYTEKVRTHGTGPRGVDWNSAESQHLRFVQLLRLLDRTAPFSLTDYGCGYGALLDELRFDRLALYQGFDIAPAMIEAAERRVLDQTASAPVHRFTCHRDDLVATDYVVASGIFNVRLGVTDDAWRQYIVDTLEHMASLSQVGFAFNVLTSYSDRDRQQPHLYYADPTWLFDHVKRRLARHVSLIHDYPLWEFTILARK